MKISVIALKPVHNGGALRAFVDLRIGPVTFHKTRYIRQDGQQGFVVPPQETWEDQGGKKHYVPLVTWPKAWSPRILEAVTTAMEDFPDGIKAVEAKTDFGREVQARAGIGGTQ